MSIDDHDFAAVLAAARRGDDSAWRRLYEAHASAVLGFLRSQRAPDPEDLLGETWLHAARDIDRFDGDQAGWRSWLITIAYHRLLDHRRARGRRPVEVGLSAAPDAPVDEADAQQRLEAEDELGDLLAGLPPRQRTLLYLRYVLDLPQREVAGIMGMSTPAAKMLQSRSLRALERRVAELDGDAGALPSPLRRRST